MTDPVFVNRREQALEALSIIERGGTYGPQEFARFIEMIRAGLVRDNEPERPNVDDAFTTKIRSG